MKQYKNKNWLKNKYLDNELSSRQIAKLCNCSHPNIRYWLIKFNISRRSSDEGIHLANANRCNLSDEAIQWINGELLGDGCLQSRSKYSARFQYGSKYLEYIQYVSDTLNSFGIKQAGKINKRHHKEMNCYSYHYRSLGYEKLLSIYKKWYPEGKKVIPKDLKLTSLVLRQEMIGDGCLAHSKKQRPYIILATCGFSIQDIEWLVKELIKLGFKATRQPARNMIHISAYSTKDFLDYIGNCPIKCYTYKWDYWRENEKITKAEYPDWERDERFTEGTEFNENSQFIIK